MKTLLISCSRLICFLGIFSLISVAQTKQVQSERQNVKEFLRQFVVRSSVDDQRETQFLVGFYDLSGSGERDAIVFLANDGWCGSGGCTTLILAPHESSYRVISKIMLTRLPIGVLATQTNGWHDLAVRVQGGGEIRAYDAKLKFDGKSYPISTSNGRAKRINSKAQLTVILPATAVPEPLFR